MGVAPSEKGGISFRSPSRLRTYPLPHLRTSRRESLAIFWDVFEDDLVQQNGDRVEVAGKCIRTYAQRFKRNGAAAGEWVHDEGTRAGRSPSASCAA